MPSAEHLIDIKEVAHTFGKSIESIRKYKNFGIIRISDKRGNKDLFNREEILEIRDRLRDLRLKGLSLSQIADQLDLSRDGATTVVDPVPHDHPLRVLIAEGEAAVRTTLGEFLKGHGYTVWEAGDGERALTATFSGNPGLILLDSALPKVDGHQVCRILKGNPVTCGIPIIITARGATSEKLKGVEQGADDYIGKPFDLEELLARIRMVTRRVYAGQPGPRPNAMAVAPPPNPD